MNAVELGAEVRSLTAEYLLSEDNPGEPLVVLMKQNFDTACWSYLPPHRVYIGDQCLKRAKPGLSPGQLKRYLRAFFRHELAHARWTERDMPLMAQELSARDIPFSLWNLFEDAAIEWLDRDRTKENFQWSEFEEVSERPPGRFSSPLQEFFLLIQLEGAGRERRMPEVVEFYDRTVSAPTAMALLPIIEEWIARFGKDAPADRFAGELQTSLQLQQDPKALSDFDQGTYRPGTPPPVEAKGAETSSVLLSDYASQVDFAHAEKLAGKFQRLFASRPVTTRSMEPSGRISARHLELERPFYKRKTTVAAVARRLHLVIDCSGSMDGQPIEDARVLAWCLSWLARAGHIKGSVILSAVVDEVAVNEVYDLPLSKDVIERIHAFGDAEGLNAAILSNQKHLAGADMVFVKTDGKIRDEPLDRRAVERKGIVVCGLYSGGVEAAGALAKHFKRFFARRTLDSVVDALLQSRLT